MKILIIALCYILLGCLVCEYITKNAVSPKGKWILILFWPAIIIMLLVAFLFLATIKIAHYIGECVVSWTEKNND